MVSLVVCGCSLLGLCVVVHLGSYVLSCALVYRQLLLCSWLCSGVSACVRVCSSQSVCVIVCYVW